MFKDLQAIIRDGFQGLLGSLADSQRGIRDVLILMIPQVATVLAAFATSVLLARGLGSAGVGKYALILSVSGVAVTLSDLGIGQTAIRFASRAASVGDTVAQMAVLRWAFRLRLLFSVIVTGLLFLLAPDLALLWKSPDLPPLIRIGLIGGIFTALASIPSIYFQSMKQFGRSASITVAQTLIALAGVALLAGLQLWSVENVVIVGLVASAVGALVFLVSIPRHALIGRNPLPRNVREGLRKIWRNPLSEESAAPLQPDDTPTTFARFNLASTLIVLVTLRLDVWLMGAFLEESQIGIYSMATRFATPMAILLTAIGGALWPRASSRLSHGEIRALLVKTFRFCSILGVMGAVYAIFAPMLAPFLFGKEFEGSTLLGQILCLRYAFAMLVAPVGVIGYSLGMVRIYWMINLLQLVAVVLINVLFLPVVGPIASALALLVNELIGASLAGIVLWKRLQAAGGVSHD